MVTSFAVVSRSLALIGEKVAISDEIIIIGVISIRLFDVH